MAKHRWTPRAALLAHAKPVSSLQFSRSGEFVASAGADRVVKIWATSALLASAAEASSAASGKLAAPRTALFGHEEGVNAASWSPDGRYLVSASDDRTARVWDVECGQTLSTLGRARSATSAFNAHGIAVDAPLPPEGDDGHAGFVFAAQFNPQGSLVATASFDESVRFWDVRTGRSVAALAAHHEPIVSACFNHDGTLLVTASYDGLARLWDVASRQCLRTIATEAPRAPLTHAQFAPNSRYVLVGALDGALRLYDYAREYCVRTYAGHASKRFCTVAAFARPRRLLCGSEDGRVCVWDVQSAALVDELWVAPSPTGGGATGGGATSLPVIAVDHHPDRPVVVASAGKALHVWEEETESDDAS
ncbi:hypothetical protein PybrP1_012386 [[Pythium] brassicae (nom. inval.)]|nr:hypothetical protein PybrP1_012386 [[Pythium] brassicae (nom. inval.)]